MIKLFAIGAAAALALALVVFAAPVAAETAPAQDEQLRINKARIDATLAKMVVGGRAAGTSALTAVYFVQTMPFDTSLHRDIRAAVYGPGYLGPVGD